MWLVTRKARRIICIKEKQHFPSPSQPQLGRGGELKTPIEGKESKGRASLHYQLLKKSIPSTRPISSQGLGETEQLRLSVDTASWWGLDSSETLSYGSAA
jgi:hypothetical protein